jgi:transposase
MSEKRIKLAKKISFLAKENRCCREISEKLKITKQLTYNICRRYKIQLSKGKQAGRPVDSKDKKKRIRSCWKKNHNNTDENIEFVGGNNFNHELVIERVETPPELALFREARLTGDYSKLNLEQ